MHDELVISFMTKLKLFAGRRSAWGDGNGRVPPMTDEEVEKECKDLVALFKSMSSKTQEEVIQRLMIRLSGIPEFDW